MIRWSGRCRKYRVLSKKYFIVNLVGVRDLVCEEFVYRYITGIIYKVAYLLIQVVVGICTWIIQHQISRHSNLITIFPMIQYLLLSRINEEREVPITKLEINIELFLLLFSVLSSLTLPFWYHPFIASAKVSLVL